MEEHALFEGGWFVGKLWDKTILVVVHVLTAWTEGGTVKLELFWPDQFREPNSVSRHITNQLRELHVQQFEELITNGTLVRIDSPGRS